MLVSGAPASTASFNSSTHRVKHGYQPPLCCIFCLMPCRDHVLQQQQQQQALPDRVVVSTGRSRQRDHVSSILRDSTSALLSSWKSPFAAQTSENSNGSSSTSSSKLEASGAAVSQWLQQVNAAVCCLKSNITHCDTADARCGVCESQTAEHG
jgi:MarR-like DNA-binding transcriptional regulator SgrR of sgrS sRNA